jgi:hypothetical protein
MLSYQNERQNNIIPNNKTAWSDCCDSDANMNNWTDDATNNCCLCINGFGK